MTSNPQHKFTVNPVEHRYRIMFDLSNDGLIVIDTNGNIKELNHAACDRLGYTKHEMIGMHFSQLNAPDFVQTAAQRFDDIKNFGQVIYECVILCKDGSAVSVEVNARLIELDGEGCIFCVVRDISKRKAAEEAFQLTKLAVEHSGEAVFWIDMEGRVINVNELACHKLGYTHNELIGMYVWDFNPTYIAADWPERMALLRRDESIFIESTHRRKDGTLFPVKINANYVRYRDKEYNIAFVHDLSDMKLIDEAVRDSEERFRQAIRNSQTGIFDHNHVTNTIYWSPELRDIYGFTADEPITMESFFACVNPEDKNKVDLAVQNAHDPRGNGLFDVKNRILRRDGQTRWVMTRSRTIFEGTDVTRRAVRTVGAVLDITERMRSEEKNIYLAYYDSLTGLANRRLLRDRLERALAVSARNRLYGALLFIDLDHFKTINDTVGHDFGDQFLKDVAQRLRAVLREADTISRPGGDEFVIILEEIGLNREQAAIQAKSISDKLLEALSRNYRLGGRDYHGSASIGVVLFRGHDDNIDELLKRSDMAMYEAKRAGRGTMRFFDPAMQATFERREVLEAEIRYALERRQFQLYYQVRVDHSGRAVGAEALLRWMHRERGIVHPEEFIALCEDTGLILPLGEWVLETACKQLQAWEAQPVTRALKLSVNISPNQFCQDNFVDQVVHALKTTGIDPSRLELELTESMFLDSIDQAIAKMRHLREMGVLFVLDDFGSGYSSISCLKKLPLSQIKIDRSFVRNIAFNKNDDSIVQTIIKMGQTLGFDVIAEGVESEEQRRRLEWHGCRNFQGYLFGEPVPIADFERILANYPTA